MRKEKGHMVNLINELQDIFQHLDSFVDKANENGAIKSLENLEASANEVGKSWSGSWLGYQSLVYYRDFIAIPAGAHFSIEWGTYKNLTQDTRGDWVECQFNQVTDYIKTKAGELDIKQARRISGTGRNLFDEEQNTLLSIFATYQIRREDPFIGKIEEKVKSMKIFTDKDWINNVRPSGTMMSRDSLAMSQGILAPPHKSILAEIFDIRSPIQACADLAKQAKFAVTHIERQKGEIQRMEQKNTNIFIGHGQSSVWKALKELIQDRLHLDYDEFNRVSTAGVTTISRLSEMLDNATFAFLVMTAEDEQPDGNLRARMNVVHEAGLFQGRLGFSRAIILLEEGCEEFSNIKGLVQIRFPKGNIKAVFEEIRQVLERENIIDS
ncbi:MAG: nucleotide-binding protein [Anaerolineaceae bacterium]|nr:nucleotide-binding protein [Anaerolineaceae bacterium]